MAFSIKNKIQFGTLFLLLLLVLSGGVSIYYQLSLTNASKNILRDNYESLEYGHAMQRQLDSIPEFPLMAIPRFEKLLRAQENNITEHGEAEATKNIRSAFTTLKNHPGDPASYQALRSGIDRILQLNMQAIERKNEHSEKDAETAYTIIILVTSISLLIALTFAFNFPSVVVTPIQKLTDAIKEISAKNYRYRIHLEQKDEFGQLADAFNTMTERLEAFENSNLNKLIFEKARAEAVINSLKDASIGIDRNRTLLFANAQALQLLGMKAEETIGKPVSALTEKNDLLKFLLENDSSSPFKIVVEGKENYYTKETVDVQQGDAMSRVIVLKNITSFKEMDVAKTNFIATVSHELKTPLASSDFSLKLLEDTRVGDLSEEQKGLVGQLRNDNQRMLRILSELLNMSQVEAGRLQLDIHSVNLYPVIETSLKAVAGTAREKNISIESHIAEQLPEVKADADKAGWVLNNFFTNAIKFSNPGTTVYLDVQRTNDTVQFSVTDHGAGIEEQYLGRIFERYFQVPGRTDTKGSGIGLAICKEFIEAMGGSVSVSSQPGQGSTFSFRIPVSV